MRTPRMAPLLVLVAALLGETATFGAAARRPAQLEPFAIKKEPSPQDWRFFIKATDADRERLWTYHAGRGVALGGWSWGWRLGWVRVCGTSAKTFCHEVLTQALFDKALVVRAEAATRFGRRYEGTGNAAVVDLLVKAYKNPRNARHGKPLFVQERILFALHRVSGERAVTEGMTLASAHQDSKTYWARLTGAR